MRYLKNLNSSSSSSDNEAFKFDKVLSYDSSDGVELNDEVTPPPDEFWYTSTDGQIIMFEEALTYDGERLFDYNTGDPLEVVEIISQTYSNGKGIVKCAGPIRHFTYCISNTQDYNRLASIKIPNTIRYFPSGIFGSQIYNMYEIEFPDNVNVIESPLFEGYDTSIRKIKFPKHLQVLAGWTSLIVGCKYLEELRIPDEVTDISNISHLWRFGGIYDEYLMDKDLWDNKKLYIGASFKSIPDMIDIWRLDPEGYTNNQADFSQVTVSEGNYTFDSRDNCNAIIETATNTLKVGFKNTVIPNTVTEIGDYAFNNSGITSLVVPNSVTKIGTAVFSYSALETIDIGTGITEIGLNDDQVYNCFTSVHLISLTIRATNPPTVGQYTLYSLTECNIYVPSGSVNAYKSAQYWSDVASNIQAIPE